MLEKYKYVIAWCKWIHPEDTDNHFLNVYLREAEEFDAPENGVFYDAEENRWITIDMITNTITKRRIQKIVDKLEVVDGKILL